MSWVRARSKWVAQIIVKGERIHIGYFDDELEAATRYDTHAAIHGKPVNFPREGMNDRQAYKNGTVRPPDYDTNVHTFRKSNHKTKSKPRHDAVRNSDEVISDINWEKLYLEKKCSLPLSFS